MKKHLCILATLGLAFTAFSGTAKADNSFSLHLEPGLAQPITTPQSSIYTTGLVLGAKGMFALDPHVSVGPSVSTLYLPRSLDNGLNAGTLWQFGGSVRLQTARGNTNTWTAESKLNHWIDRDAMLANTGNLQRPAFDIGIGAETPLDQNHIFWFGPFLRYTHVFQTSGTQDALTLDTRDINILQAGLSFSFDAPTHPKTERVETVRTVTKPELVIMVPPCPPQMEAVAQPPVVTNLSTVVYFDHDSSVLRWESRDKLDAVVKQINASNTKTFKVEGHASADGQLLHNNVLATKRAMAVVDYLVAHGVELKRLQVASFGVSVPAAPNTSKEGRERNRRTEVTVTFTSVNSK